MKKKQQVKQSVFLPDCQATEVAGRELAKELIPGTVIGLFGDLGAGKTTLCKGIISAHCSLPIQEILSPTFTYLEIYEALPPIYHFDLYRIETESEFRQKGFDEYLTANGVCLLEWAQKVEDLLPDHAWRIELVYDKDKGRTLHVWK